MSHYTEDKGDYEPKIKFPDLGVAAYRRLMEKAHEKHPEDDWDKHSAGHHIWRAFAHLSDYVFRGIRRDPETGESPLLHALCRLLMAVHIIELKRIECEGT